MSLLSSLRTDRRPASPAARLDKLSARTSSSSRAHESQLAFELAHNTVQPPLKVGSVDDPLELEAERFADETCCGDELPGASPSSERGHTTNKPPVQRQPGTRRHAHDGGAVHDLAFGEGRPLDAAQRAYFEPRMGRDLAGVRIHTDNHAARTAEQLGARAFTVGPEIAFAPTEYRPETRPGQRLLAHEIAHVIQQGTADPAVVRRQPSPKPTELPPMAPRSEDQRHSRGSGPVDWKPGMQARLLVDHYGFEVKVKAGTLVEIVAPHGFGFFQVQLVDPKARTKKLMSVNDIYMEPVGPTTTAPEKVTSGPGPTCPAAGSPAGVYAMPVPVNYDLVGMAAPGTELETGTGWGAAAGRSTAIGGARGLGFLISPPVRGPLDPLLPLASRLSPPAGPLGVAGDTATLERYLTSPAGELTPRYTSELPELFMRQSHGESWWLNNFGLTERQLGELQGLVARMAEGGIESLAPAEQQLVATFLRAHAQSVAAPGMKIASPALSTTAREGLSGVAEAAPFFREAPYVVRIQVPAASVVDVNAVMGAERMPSLVYEAEMLVFTDARGSITSVRPNPVSSLGRATPALRWVGRGFLVIGIGISAYRIANATPEELPRVLGEEGGGWLGGFGGSALGAGACIAFGIVTEGFGLLLCGAVGGIGGGLAGSYLGGELGEALGGGFGGHGGVPGPHPRHKS